MARLALSMTLSIPADPMPTRRVALVGGLSVLASPACAVPGANLRRAAAGAGRQFGAAIEPQHIEQDGDFARLVQQQCGLLTAENAMKWNQLRPSRDRFDFAQADRVAAIAAHNKVPMHGHCLVWHEANPDWLTHSLSPRNARALLSGHIETVVNRFAGRVTSWDVVNEAVERNDRRPDGLRKSMWLQALGADYLELAFRAAHAADPKARLALADYGLEYDDEPWMVEKRGTMLILLRNLISRGVPIHILALQGHLLGDRPAAFGKGLSEFLSAVADLGLDVFITELDVNDQNTPGSPSQRDQAAAEIYGRFLETVLRVPAVKSVVTWGLSDRYTSKSWFAPRADGATVRPLPFDRDLVAKPAVARMLRAFQSTR